MNAEKTQEEKPVIKELKPTSNRILVRPEENPYDLSEADRRVRSKIMLSENTTSTKKSYAFGTVLEVGPDVTQVDVGDEIYYSIHVGYVIQLYSKDYVIMRDADVMVAIKDSEEQL